MTYLNTNDRTTKPTSNENFKPLGRVSTLLGVFMGYVKRVDDVQRMGRLKVWIPEFGSTPEDENGWITASYCSPFAGATNVATISKSDLTAFESTQTSYGMWMVPPDIGNQVLVMFINGESHRAIWFGVLYNQFANHMVPGNATSKLNYQFPGKDVPVAEYNKWDKRLTNPDSAMKPYHRTKFKGLGNQGLVVDPNRGVSDSSARRESPSEVFGIITPGPKIHDTDNAANIRRKGGSSFIMDDATGSEYIQLVTKSGAQIKLNETNGFVYIINRDGTSWIQMDQKGNVDIFGAKDISMRAQRDFNIRADRNVNIEAGQNVFIKAAKDTVERTTTFTYDINNVPKPSTIPFWDYVGEGEGIGGQIVLQAVSDIHSTAKERMFITALNQGIDIFVGKDIKMPNYLPTKGKKAEIKPLIDQVNVLATWSDPETKFKRNAKAIRTTVTRFPTYETCPQHEAFTYKSTIGYTPIMTPGDQTYIGSGAPGNDTGKSPEPDTTPGANNTEVKGDKPPDSAVTKYLNINAFRCQLVLHEGYREVVYVDTEGYPTAGIGHLLRKDEIPKYPVGSRVSAEQVEKWYDQDSVTAIKGAQRYIGIDTWNDLSEIRKRALADMYYNLGPKLGEFVRLRAAVQKGDWVLAEHSLRDSKWFRQVGRRANNIIAMITKDTDVTGCGARHRN